MKDVDYIYNLNLTNIKLYCIGIVLIHCSPNEVHDKVTANIFYFLIF